jgi:hypothetical protein
MNDNDPPPAPDPFMVAAAQTQSNRDTAVANANLNRFDQYAPQGSLTYKIVGTNADGTPKYESTQAYSPEEQKIYDLNTTARTNLGQIGVDATQRLGGILNTEFNPDQAISDKITSLGKQRLDPQFQQQQATLEQQLANKGIGVGTTAYQRAMDQFGKTKNDAYNQLYLTGDNQAFSQSLAARNQPFNEIAALMNGSQVSNPMMGQAQQTNQANTDVGGIVNQAYKNQLDAYNASQSQNNAMMGGIFGVAGSVAGALPWSDVRLKRDIVKIGHGALGLPLYSFKYIWDSVKTHIGYIAQEVEKVMPAAVHEFNGLKAVDYAMLEAV